MLLLSISASPAWAQASVECGEVPVEPEIVDGAAATLEELVANSKAVNAFIEEVDLYLDCSEQRYKQLSASKVHRDKLASEIKAITSRRNDIGDEFNEQVAVFKSTNPN